MKQHMRVLLSLVVVVVLLTGILVVSTPTANAAGTNQVNITTTMGGGDGNLGGFATVLSIGLALVLLFKTKRLRISMNGGFGSGFYPHTTTKGGRRGRTTSTWAGWTTAFSDFISGLASFSGNGNNRSAHTTTRRHTPGVGTMSSGGGGKGRTNTTTAHAATTTT